jgi:hypothetical protein
MRLLLDVLQGVGVSAATGIRPFLPALLVGALAADDLGVDFDGTSFAFLESPWFLLLLAVGLVASVLLRGRLEDGPGRDVLRAIGVALGALLFAATLDDRFDVWWPGLIGGILCAAFAAAVATAFFRRVRTRLDPDAAGALPIYAESAAVVAAGLSVLFPPFAVVVVGFLIFLLRGGKRREGEKFAGLRILR